MADLNSLTADTENNPGRRANGRPKHRLGLLVLTAVLMILSAAPQTAQAKRRVIFQLANLRQWTELEYTFNYNWSEGAPTDRSSESHELAESYHLGIDYAILSQRLAYGSLELDLGLNQAYEVERGFRDRNATSNGFELEYQFDLLMFERRPYPLTLFSSRFQERVNAPFSRDYDRTNTTLSTALSLQNRHLPVRLSYTSNTSETSGLEFDRQQESTELRLNAYLDNSSLSKTELQALTASRRSDVEGPRADTRTDSYSLEARNSLHWELFSQEQLLFSSYRLQQDRGTSELRTENWSERLRLRLGEALQAGLVYGYKNTRSPLQFRREKKAEAWLEHQLFKSLNSRFEQHLTRLDFANGREDRWRRFYRLAYTKRLPRESRIRIAYNYSYGESDRNLVDQRSFAAESLTVEPGQTLLTQFDIESDTVQVLDENRAPFQEGVDYFLTPVGRRLALSFPPFPTPNGITPGDILTIEYFHRVNNSIEFSTTVNGLSTSLELFNNRYRIYGSLSRTDQDLLAGQANVSPLAQQRYFQVGAEADWGDYTVGGNYSLLDSTISREKYFEAFINYHKVLKTSSLNLRLTERFTSSQQNEGLLGTSAAATREKNSIRLNAHYKRKLLRNTTLTFKGYLADIRGDRITQDELSLGMLLEARWYKFLLQLDTEIVWQLYDGDMSHDERISISLRRYF